jgi:peptide/nickel transport system permease protein
MLDAARVDPPKGASLTPMATVIAQRVALRVLRLAIVIWAASAIIFAAIFIVGDPAKQVLPVGSSPEALAEYRQATGLDRPLVEQYLDFAGNAIQGDFGQSLRLNQPATTIVLDRLPVTAALVVMSIVLASIVGIPLGIIAAVRPGSWSDNLFNVMSYVLTSIPQFWLGLMLILLIAVPSDSIATSGFAWDPAHLALPVITLAALPMGRIAQVTRALMISEANQQYVTTARAKGLSERTVAVHHQLRNAGIPLVTLIFYDMARMFVGDALLVEVVFGLPGVGGIAVVALQTGDIFVAEAAVMLAAVVVAVLNVIADITTYFMDPRARAAVAGARQA